jgi:hypothetical protein
MSRVATLDHVGYARNTTSVPSWQEAERVPTKTAGEQKANYIQVS